MSAYPETAPELAEVFRLLTGWVRDEVAGLTEEQFARSGPEEWAAWPPLYQISHMAYITTRWFMVLYGAPALPWRPVDMSQFGSFINTPEDDRRFSAERYPDVEWLLARLGEACGAAAARLDDFQDRPEEGEALLFVFGEGSLIGATDERALDLWERNAPCHPGGVFFDRARGEVRLTTFATLRHVLWDDLIHLRSLRMHREAMGLAPAHPDAPAGGYAPAFPLR